MKIKVICLILINLLGFTNKTVSHAGRTRLIVKKTSLMYKSANLVNNNFPAVDIPVKNYSL